MDAMHCLWIITTYFFDKGRSAHRSPIEPYLMNWKLIKGEGLKNLRELERCKWWKVKGNAELRNAVFRAWQSCCTLKFTADMLHAQDLYNVSQTDNSRTEWKRGLPRPYCLRIVTQESVFFKDSHWQITHLDRPRPKSKFFTALGKTICKFGITKNKDF